MNKTDFSQSKAIADFFKISNSTNISSPKKIYKLGIIGAGSYGTALAQCFNDKVEEIVLISDIEAIALSINELHMHKKALPGIFLSKNISCSTDVSKIKDCDLVFIAVPSNVVASVCHDIRDFKIESPVVLCSKGVDVESGKLLSFVVEEILDGNQFAVLSGPSFSQEIASGLCAGVNIAGKDFELLKMISENLSSDSFKIEAIDDYIGLQVSGAFKNILAVGCGIFRRLGAGESAIAQLIVKSISEMRDLTIKIGGKAETLLQLGGIGDIILTCTSQQSRNILFGEHLASGGTLSDWNGLLAEGAFSAKAIPLFEKNYDIRLKIFSRIYEAIYGN